MRVLRLTLWRGMNTPGLVTVNREQDFRVPIEQALEGLLETANGTLSTYDLFEMPDPNTGSAEGDALQASIEAGKRTRAIETEERNMSVLYFWVTGMWDRGIRGAVIAVKDPSPLSADQIQTVFKQLAKHPDYRDFTLSSVTKDQKTMVRLMHGEVECLPL